MRRIGKWAVELAPFMVSFVDRIAVKSQILADFIAEWTLATTEPNTTPTQDIWTIYTDGAYCSTGVGDGAVLISPTCQQVQYAARLDFKTTNNIAEYEAILLGLRKARALGAARSSPVTSSRTSKSGIQT